MLFLSGFKTETIDDTHYDICTGSNVPCVINWSNSSSTLAFTA